METISLTLPTETIERLRDQVARGVFPTEHHAVQEAVRQMEERAYRAKLERFHEMLTDAIAQADRGETTAFDPDALFREIDEELDGRP